MSITAVFVSINLCEGMDAAKRNEAGQRNNGTFEKKCPECREPSG